MPRVFLEFQRTASVVERGAVGVDVDETDNIQDVYKRALNKEFREFLIKDRHYVPESEKWEFEIMKEETAESYSNDDDPFTPNSA